MDRRKINRTMNQIEEALISVRSMKFILRQGEVDAKARHMLSLAKKLDETLHVMKLVAKGSYQ